MLLVSRTATSCFVDLWLLLSEQFWQETISFLRVFCGPTQVNHMCSNNSGTNIKEVELCNRQALTYYCSVLLSLPVVTLEIHFLNAI